MRLFNFSPVFKQKSPRALATSSPPALHDPSRNTDSDPSPDLKNSATESRKLDHERPSSDIPAFPDELITSASQLPSLKSARSKFKTAYPKYKGTLLADEVRSQEYQHLSKDRRVYLNYHGLGLFSSMQRILDQSSCSFVCKEIAESLAMHLQYGKAMEGTMEYHLSKDIMAYLNISDEEYCMVFVTDQGSGFKLLADSFSFSTNPRVLTVYDHENESVNLMVQSAKGKGAKIMSACFKWPSMSIRSTDLRQKLMQKKRKKENSKGLFVFPMQSKISGAKYSYQWMKLAEKLEWRVLLDASALGPKDMDSLGLSLYRPDFIICSFYKIFGLDNSGFACLCIKKSSISCLENSPPAEKGAMIGIFPDPSAVKPMEGTQIAWQEGEEDHDLSFYHYKVHTVTQLLHTNKDRNSMAEILVDEDTCSLTDSTDGQPSNTNSRLLSTDTAGYEDKEENSRGEENHLEEWVKRKDIQTRSLDFGQSRKSWYVPSKECGASSSSHPKIQTCDGENCRVRDCSHEVDSSFEIVEDQSSLFDDHIESSSYSFPIQSDIADEEAICSVEEDLLSVRRFYSQSNSQSNSRGSAVPRQEIHEEEDLIHRRVGRDNGLIDSRKFDYFATQSRTSSRYSSILEADEDCSDLENPSQCFIYRKKGKDPAGIQDGWPSDGEDYGFKRASWEKSEDYWSQDNDDQISEPSLLCRNLQHATSLGLTKISDRLRSLTNWLVLSLNKLHYPHRDGQLHPLVQIYGPKTKYHRGAAIAFNLMDLHGQVLPSEFVQRIAEKKNISLLLGFISNIDVSSRNAHGTVNGGGPDRSSGFFSPMAYVDQSTGELKYFCSFPVLTASLTLLSSFEDVYTLWVFIAKFLDPSYANKQKSLHGIS